MHKFTAIFLNVRHYVKTLLFLLGFIEHVRLGIEGMQSEHFKHISIFDML